MKIEKCYTADFETTTSEPAKVWAWAICSIVDENMWFKGTKISEFLATCKMLKNPTLYFHNLKFDVSYIFHYLLTHGYQWKLTRSACTNKSFTTVISDMGQFYACEIYFTKDDKHTEKVTIYDSLKLINMPVESVAKTFGLPVSKSIIDYDRHNTECEITADEWHYLYLDVKIMALALREMFSQGLTKMTIGSCALADYKKFIGEKKFKYLFPVLPAESDAKIRHSYRGGFTYANPERAGEDIGKGIVFDVNSLYPSVMAFRPLPYGIPLEFSGQYNYNSEYPLYIQHIRCFFKLKPGYIPTIQIKGSAFFQSTKYLESSVDKQGKDQYTDLYLTNPDLELFLEHYNTECLEYVGGYMFKSSTTLFKDWVEKWNAEKVRAALEHNKGKRQIAKLILNNLYGKFATNPQVSSKYPVLVDNIVKYPLVHYDCENENGDLIRNEDGTIKQTTIQIRDSIYIPVGTFVTAWARYTTITASQKIHSQSMQLFGVSRYLYSDTDSIHLEGFEIPDCIEVDSVELGKWKLESHFERGRFLQAKRYIEEEIVEGDNGELLKNSYGDYITKLKVTCAGMPAKCHKYVTWENFKLNAENPQTYKGKLIPIMVEGGLILVETPFTLK